MSSISNNPGLDPAALRLGLGQVAFDDPRQRGAEQAADIADAAGVETVEQARGPLADPGETVLQLQAWDGSLPGQRLLPGEAGLEQQLSAQPLSAAADHGVEAVLETLY